MVSISAFSPPATENSQYLWISTHSASLFTFCIVVSLGATEILASSSSWKYTDMATIFSIKGLNLGFEIASFALSILFEILTSL